MKTMSMPGFTGEASLYRTNNRYRVVAGSGFLTKGNTNVIPQDCRWWLEAPICAALIPGGAVICTADCLAGLNAGPLGGFPCWVCWTGYLGALYGFCRDCIPAWMKAIIDAFESAGGGGGGGGGGGPIPCCPENKPYCCGICQPRPDGRGEFCDDQCAVDRGHCP